MPMPELDTPSPAQKRAISVCSGVRVAELMAPRDLTSWYASVYLSLVSSGGGPARNWSPLFIANGATYGHCGKEAASPGSSVPGVGPGRGVGCQSPGSVPGVYDTTAPDPSFARHASIWAATYCPR